MSTILPAPYTTECLAFQGTIHHSRPKPTFAPCPFVAAGLNSESHRLIAARPCLCTASIVPSTRPLEVARSEPWKPSLSPTGLDALTRYGEDFAETVASSHGSAEQSSARAKRAKAETRTHVVRWQKIHGRCRCSSPRMPYSPRRRTAQEVS